MGFKRAASTCAFALAAAANAVLETLYYAPGYLAEYGALALAHELALQLAVYFLLGLGMTLVLLPQMARPAQTLRRPGRFLLIVAIAAAPLNWLANMAVASVHQGHLVLQFPNPPQFLDGWARVVLWAGLFCWLHLLYWQRREDQLRLSAVLAGRALLSQQLAQAELLAARASIDPAMVAGVLRKVQARYAQDPQGGADLLDQLVGYLRLALNRNGRSGEAAAAALQALRKAAQ